MNYRGGMDEMKEAIQRELNFEQALEADSKEKGEKD